MSHPLYMYSVLLEFAMVDEVVTQMGLMTSRMWHKHGLISNDAHLVHNPPLNCTLDLCKRELKTIPCPHSQRQVRNKFTYHMNVQICHLSIFHT